jgi:hypothetical protein
MARQRGRKLFQVLLDNFRDYRPASRYKNKQALVSYPPGLRPLRDSIHIDKTSAFSALEGWKNLTPPPTGTRPPAVHRTRQVACSWRNLDLAA